MQRLANPSDYVRQDVLGQSTYVLPWEPRLCPGNPTDDPELGAQMYNEFACNAAQGKHQFRLEDLQHWDEETKAHRFHLIFHNEELRALSARTFMALRVRAEKA